jgi:tRNA pseudouridine38-40 synthase
MRYFFRIAYKGTHYRGWQRQLTATSIQEVIEDVLTKVLNVKTIIIGCGRTDAGVHAHQYYFHADINDFPDYNLTYRLNRNLPDDISIMDIINVPLKSHARYDAISRSYAYSFHTKKDPFMAESSSYIMMEGVNIDLINAALNLLTQQTDYRHFCRTPDRHNTTIVKVQKADIIQINSYSYRINITANRFLKSMIRIIAYRVLEVGNHKLSLREFESYFTSGNSGIQVLLAPPQGLSLTEVIYPYPLTDTVIFNV